jgi:hypothetical protein
MLLSAARRVKAVSFDCVNYKAEHMLVSQWLTKASVQKKRVSLGDTDAVRVSASIQSQGEGVG